MKIGLEFLYKIMNRAGGKLPEYDSTNTNEDTIKNNIILMAAIDKLAEGIVIDKTYDIPYVAGYSKNRTTIYIDKDFSQSLKNDKGDIIDLEKFIVLHEIIEKSLIDLWKLHYHYAHQIALRLEEVAVESYGINLIEYNTILEKWIKEIDSQEIIRIPKDLDLTPYEDEKDFELIELMKKSMQ